MDTLYLKQKNEDGEVYTVTFSTIKEVEFYSLIRSIVYKADFDAVGVCGTDVQNPQMQRLVAYADKKVRINAQGQSEGYFFSE